MKETVGGEEWTREVLEGLRRGESRAVEALHDRYASGLISTARDARAGDATAQDAVADAFSEALGAARGGRFARFRARSRDALGRWLRTVVRRRVRDRRRRGRGDVGLDSGGLPAKARTPSSLYSEKELGALVADIVEQRLGPRERAAWALRAVDGRPHAEIARILGTSESRARALVSEARAKIARVLLAALEPRPSKEES